MTTTAPLPLATLEGVLERITYANEETGYTVARVTTGRSTDLLTVVGNLLGAQPGESLRMQGRWTSHAQYGRQFEVHNYTTVLPATVQGLRRYLGSGLIKGIGPKMAERIVAYFDLDTLRIIEEEPQRLSEVPGARCVCPRITPGCSSNVRFTRSSNARMRTMWVNIQTRRSLSRSFIRVS
jgi:exodeoxyribonuclease V alpha subunit